MLAKGDSVSRIFHAIYDARRISKQLLSKKLGLSLPTVSAGLRTLEKQGFVVRRGSYASTGGRPAVAYEFVSNARFAVASSLPPRTCTWPSSTSMATCSPGTRSR